VIPDSFIEELKYNSDIGEVISSYVSLKKKGRTLSGLCPFHSEKTPSFTVYPDTQSYYCFGCGAGGDVITFIRQHENLEYIEALKLLAGRAGMKLPEDTQDDKTARLKARILEMNREAARFFYSNLTGEAGKPARAYLLARGLAPKTIKQFGLGYAPDNWDSLRNHLRGKGFSYEEMLSAALVQKGRGDSVYDSFRGRIIFPIIDLRGNVIGFGGRDLGERGPKYLNSADTPVFKKSRGLYALNFAKEAKSDTLLLAEGYMDVIAIHQAGFPNAVATLGTALTPEQARLISKYAKNAVIAYDSDGAGQSATKRAISLFSQTDVTVRVLEITGAKDPDEYIKKYGAARFGNLISGGKGAVRFEIDKLKHGYNLELGEDKVAFLSEFCTLMAGVPNALERDVYISEIARELEVGKDGLITTTQAIRKRNYHTMQKKQSHNLRVYAQDNPAGKTRASPNKNLKALVAQEKLIAMIVQNPDYYSDIQSRIAVKDFPDEALAKIYAAIAQRLGQGLPADPIHLSALLDPAQMSTLSRIISDGREIQFYRGQIDEFVDAIRSEKEEKTKEEVAGMTPEEYRRYITSLTAKKK